MRPNTIIKTMIIAVAIAANFGSTKLSAQSFSLEYDTEWQTDFKGSYDWLNYLQLNVELPLCNHLQFDVETLSTAKTGDHTLIDDMLTYSNIEAGNLPLTIARLGFAIEAGKSNIFLGVNNVNEDYFTSDYTSFFTNSSGGITPTLSCNYDIANFPLASLGLYYGIQLGDFKLQTSLYPGQGYKNIVGRDNVFKFNLKTDGVFSISSLEYKHNNIYCCVGAAVFDGVCIYDKESEASSEAPQESGLQAKAPQHDQKYSKAYKRSPLTYPILPLGATVLSRGAYMQDYTAITEGSSAEKELSFTPWILTEISLPANFGLLVHGSFSTVKEGCKSYAGLGVLYDINKFRAGVSANYASFTGDKECDIELTAQIPVYEDKAHIQPALHIITGKHTGENAHSHCIGMLRFTLNI